MNIKAFFIEVGMTGFEPATLWSQTRCATGLRYIPIFLVSIPNFDLLFSHLRDATSLYFGCGESEIRTRGTVSRTSV